MPSTITHWLGVLGVATVVGCGGGSASVPGPKTEPDAQATQSQPSAIVVTSEMGSPHPGDEAPDFELPDQNGNKTKLSSLRGSIVVLAFVASWCPFSKAEQPNLKTVSEAYAGRNVKFIAVDVNENDEGYQKYLARVALKFPVLRDADGAVSRSYAPPKAVPSFKDRTQVVVTSNLVIDPQGVIRYFGLVDTQNFDDKLSLVKRVVDDELAKSTAP